MEILILTGTLMSAFFVGFFISGFVLGMKYQQKKEDVFKVEDEETAKALSELAEWVNYDGGKR